MPSKKNVYGAKIKHRGIWKFSDVYTMMFNWLKSEGYNVNEVFYKEVAGDGKEIVIEWEASRKVTDYFKYVIIVKWHILGMKDSEVEIEGKVQKMNKGELTLKVEANIVRDYAGDWEGKAFYKFLREIFEKHIIPSSVKEYEDDLEDKAKEFADDIKAFLRLSSN